MAADYVSTCASSSSECHSDETASDGPIIGNRSCDVYVWGSNSSHQLAECAQEKLTSPKQASAFLDVVEVCLCLMSLSVLVKLEDFWSHFVQRA